MILPNKKYKILLIDPPWSYEDKAKAGNRGAESHYDVMSLQEIKNLHIKQISDDDSVLFLWATFPLLNQAIHIMEPWGFEYKTVAFTWIKTTNTGSFFMGMGNWTRSNAELCLLGVRGKPKRINGGISQIIKTAYNGIHSKKPDIVRKRIVQLCGDLPRIELFGRTRIEGWDVFGNDHKLELQPLEVFS